ncbi:MAG TPA: aminoglycoside 3'-phosphotransferase [Caulobacteraceae bacterium]|jgi:aminoglycoside phosphotransferase
MTDDERLALARAVAAAAGLPAPTDVAEVGHGKSGDVVLRFGGHFAKVVDPALRVNAGELARESAMLLWLEGHAPAAHVVWTGDLPDGRRALVTDALPGAALHELAPADAERGAIAALTTLSKLHALPIAGCPFDEQLAIKLAEAARRVAAGEVKAEELEDRQTPVAAQWAALSARQPPSEDLVVTHGDACWPNFVLGPDGVAAMLDLGRGGLADRHQDLALFIRSGTHNFPDLPVREIVASHYVGGAVDEAKLDFYRTLDEFF